MMAASQLRILVSGQRRLCCLQDKDNLMIVCTCYETVGHCAGEYRNKPVCIFCDKEHPTAHHICLVLSCKKVAAACTHLHRLCLLCNLGEHFTGHRECAALHSASSPPPRLGLAMPVVTDQTSVVGVSDDSRESLRH